MEVNLTSTSMTTSLVIDGVIVPARVWEGVTAKGVPCVAFITRIRVMHDQDTAEFDQDLQECRPPSPEVGEIPLRLVL